MENKEEETIKTRDSSESLYSYYFPEIPPKYLLLDLKSSRDTSE